MMKRNLFGNAPMVLTACLLICGLALIGCTPREPKPSGDTPQTTASPKRIAEPASSERHEVEQARPSAAETTKPQQPAKQEEPEEKPATEPAAAKSPESSLSEQLENVQEKPRDLGPPLVDNPASLIRLSREEPIWVDRQNKHVVLQGEVCRAGYPLEFFATYSNRAYEAVVSVNVKPSTAHAGLLAVGAKPGHPAKFQPEFVPPTGTEVAIDVRWKDDKGKVQTAPAQHWIRNIKTGKPLDSNWVFAGSGFIRDEATGKEYYMADSGELICVLSLPTAMLDLPIRSYGALEARSFEAFEEHLPPAETPVTIILKPILTTAGKPTAEPAVGAVPSQPSLERQEEAITKAIEAVQPWLMLLDGGEYGQSWETAADYLKKTVERRNLVKSFSQARKPLGAVKSRKLESKKYLTCLPQAPEGQYVLLQYKTDFEHKNGQTETVTMMLDKDKKWRFSGYYVK